MFASLCLVTFQSSAQANDVTFSIGFAGNQGGYYAVGQESRQQTAKNTDGLILTSVVEEAGAFEDSHPSFFAEINIGDNMTVGAEWALEDIQTPTNTNVRLDRTTGAAASASNTVKASFNDKTTVYIQARMLGGIYSRIMYHNVNVVSEESLATGSAYGDATVEGLGLGLGYQLDLDDIGIFIRAEVSASAYEDTKAVSTAATGNVIRIDNMYGAEGSIRVGKTF